MRWVFLEEEGKEHRCDSYLDTFLHEMFERKGNSGYLFISPLQTVPLLNHSLISTLMCFFFNPIVLVLFHQFSVKV